MQLLQSLRYMLREENTQRPWIKHDNMEEKFLGSLTAENKTLDQWFADLKIGGGHLKFKIDTEVFIIVISHQTHKSLRNRPP